MKVSILVVLEDMLKGDLIEMKAEYKCSFNPCCIGRYAKSIDEATQKEIETGFNPCCIGRYAKRSFTPSR